MRAKAERKTVTVESWDESMAATRKEKVIKIGEGYRKDLRWYVTEESNSSSLELKGYRGD